LKALEALFFFDKAVVFTFWKAMTVTVGKERERWSKRKEERERQKKKNLARAVGLFVQLGLIFDRE
jgi:hypothetical protein